MAGENDLIKLYSERILALATQLPPSSRLDNPEASVKKRSPLCGCGVYMFMAAVLLTAHPARAALWHELCAGLLFRCYLRPRCGVLCRRGEG